ncbi:hypothetical protein GDO78_014002 [Eleutherodactylus coqui]|uniref:Uncharacterized protein n=1 Tax=Eleutherodactylus coqui TaxID=57060 RepID=A0A8J6EQ82_ELECQ|nr:hypothetical protein GDO78_014002 [Eleutherodactylus coqui]
MDGYEHITIYTYKNDTRITSVIENKSDKKIMVQVNNDQSKNCISSRGLSMFAVEVPGKSTMVKEAGNPYHTVVESWHRPCMHALANTAC